MNKNVLILDGGSIVNPVVHDACIFGLIMVVGKKLLILMQPVNSSILCIAMNDVDCLRADDFREGNIVLDITVSKGSEVEIEDVAYAYGLEMFLSLDSHGYLKKAMDDFISEEKFLVQVSPSYGCKLVCICSGVEVLQDWTSEITAFTAYGNGMDADFLTANNLKPDKA